MSLKCRKAARVSLQAVANQATEADRLELEEHLESCARCREEHSLVGTVRVLKDAHHGLSDMAREKVRRNALALAQARRVSSTVQRRFRLGWVGAGALSAAAVIAVLVVAWRPAPSRIVDGDIVVVGARGRVIHDGAQLQSERGGHVVLRGSAAELAPGTAARWRDGASTVELERGSITVEVTPNRGQRFHVATRRFVVEVVGTLFTVTPRSVSTARGKVRVLKADGTLMAIVSAGEEWSVPEEAKSSAPSPAPVSAAIAPAAPARPAARAKPSVAVTIPSSTSTVPDPMAAARRALAHGDADGARGLLRPLLRGPRKTAVEARALLAESFLIEGRYSDATDSYRAVVRDFDGTVQAESALYAIAQLEVDTRQMADAIQTLRRYLTKYPQGRFAKEARDRLDLLGTRVNR